MVHIVQDGIITVRTLFPNRLWIHQVSRLQPAQRHDLKQTFEEGKYCANKYINIVIAEVKIYDARMN